MKRNLLIITIFALLSIFMNAYADDYGNRFTIDTEDYNFTRSFVETPPPVAPVRPVGEFEPMSQVLIRYPLGIPTGLVAQFSNVIPIVCLVSSTSVQNQAINAFQSAGVNMANVSFLIAATNTYWVRDYGPFFIFDGNNDLAVVDFPYNRPRPSDDEIPRTFAFTYNYPLYGMNITNTGGNYMGDSVNGGAQTSLVYSENTSQTEQQINQKMHDYMGIDNYHVLDDPNGDYIEHIDCWSKFLAPDKILIRSVPTSHAQYNEIEAVVDYFENQNCAWGYPYKVYRVYTPQNQPYTNSLILNNNVYVPTMSSSSDAAALQSYRSALPGYNVVGITGATSTPWQSTDALHCRAHEIPDRDMLYVNHMPYHGLNSLQSFYNFNAYILPYSGMPVIDDSLFIEYKVNQGPWQSLMLTNVSGYNYTTMLSGLAPGDTIRYFIHAADQSGRSINHPITGELDPHMFWVTTDNVPPFITHTPVEQVWNEPLMLELTAQVTDNFGVESVQVIYKVDNGPETAINMVQAENNIWSVSFLPVFPPLPSHFYYKIVAGDISNPPNISYSPAQGWYEPQIMVTSAEDVTISATALSLDMIYPNPFSLNSGKNLTISYTAKANTPVKILIYNVRGQLLNTYETIAINAGNHKLTLNQDNLRFAETGNGVYLLRLVTPEVIATGKFLILK
jgi:agmatine deiminase